MKILIFFMCRVPYLALAKTLEAIEATSSRLKNIEILANYFRSVMILSPDDMRLSVYLCLNKLAPAYEGTDVVQFIANIITQGLNLIITKVLKPNALLSLHVNALCESS